MKTDRILGFVFILVGGIIYSIKRAVSILSTSMIRAGFFAGSMTGEVPNVEASGAVYFRIHLFQFSCVWVWD